jgi:hypothetical protein
MRVYIRIREMILTNKDIVKRLDSIETKLSENDNQIMLIFEYLKQFEEAKQLESEQKNRPQIGYKPQKGFSPE